MWVRSIVETVIKVFTNGCFDILHRGHIELLAYCKSIGRVTVGLNSDSSIKRLKGEKRPINMEKDRKRVLESLRYVDEVVIFEEDTPYELIRKLEPDLIVKGGDYRAEEIVGNDLCEVRIFDFLNGYSTSRIVSKIES
jgi:D-beta-D-heptose 7-phosphate kinase/D-beta-D-heptose 1-phosphate adenosyltransferase